jgi:hypothetical protein
MLVVAQIAISLLLVTAAGLFIRTLENLHSVPLGFNQENLLIFKVNASEAGYKDQALARFYEGLAERFRGAPGVRSAGFAKFPLVAGFWNDEGLTIPGAPQSTARKPSACIAPVDASFLATMQIPILTRARSQHARHSGPPLCCCIRRICKKVLPGGRCHWAAFPDRPGDEGLPNRWNCEDNNL